MSHKLEVAFVQGTAFISKAISTVSKKINKDDYKGNFNPSHVLLILDNDIVFESSTYKKDDTKKQSEQKQMERRMPSHLLFLWPDRCCQNIF